MRQLHRPVIREHHLIHKLPHYFDALYMLRSPRLHSRVSSDSPSPASRVLNTFRAAGGLYQWTRVAIELKGSGPYLQRSMQNKVLNGLVFEVVCMDFDNFWRQKKSNLMRKKNKFDCVWILIIFVDFCYSYGWSILHASWCYPTINPLLEKVFISNFNQESFRRSRYWLF